MTKERKYPVAEIFGPTVQGEGLDQGVPCYFIRFGGCDFKCGWCDTPHAVLPELVRRNERLTTDEIIARLDSLPEGPQWVVLSGGNPCLHDLTGVVNELTMRGMLVSVETQGTRYHSFLKGVDRICISPKPPSSGMRERLTEVATIINEENVFNRGKAPDGMRIFLKVVVFDNLDYEFAVKVHKMFPHVPFFLSAGNDAGATVGNPSRRDTRSTEQVRNDLLNRARWLTNKVMVDPVMRDARVQAQYHVALWGNELGR